ncbi:MAG: imelysin family protein [Bacteroidota bacterium]
MRRFLMILFPTLLFVACDPTEEPKVDDFDRQPMLIHWADNIIIPGFQAFVAVTEDLETAAAAFNDTPDASSLETLRTAWETAYLEWQKTSIYDVGKAGELDMLDFINTYPVEVEGIIENIESGEYKFILPSQKDRQGFPALDYMLYGVGDTDAAILEKYTSDAMAAEYRQYIVDLAARINSLADEVLADWEGGFRDSFVNNSGNNANASVDLVVNDFIFHYEKHLRAGKVGIPGGVFSGTPLSKNVEALYRGDFSRDLLNEALDFSQAFFNGEVNGKTGPSLKDYLDYLQQQRAEEGTLLSTQINNQFEASREAIATLNPNFAEQVETDVISLLAAYDQLQLNVPLMKVDMLQILCINVDYIDGDGD